MKAPDWSRFRFHLFRNPAGPLSSKTNWMAAMTYKSAKKSAWRGCPKRGNNTYHIVPMDSKPVTHRRVTGSVCANTNEQLKAPQRTQQLCQLVIRAWESVSSETFLSTSTKSFASNLHAVGMLCIVWLTLKNNTNTLPLLSFRANAFFLARFVVLKISHKK